MFSSVIFNTLSVNVASNPKNLCGLAELYQPLFDIAPRPFPKGLKYSCKNACASLISSTCTCDFEVIPVSYTHLTLPTNREV